MSHPENIPSWTRCKFGDVLSFEYGKALKKADRNESGPYDVFGSSGVVGKHDKSLIDGPAIVVGRKGSVGSVYYSEQGLWPIDTTYYVTPPKYFDGRYLAYYLGFLNLSELDTSTAVPGLNRNDAYRAKIFIPPLNEQHRIVAKIEELFSELDKGVESLQTARAQLKTYRQSLLKAAFEGLLSRRTRSAPWRFTEFRSVLDFLTSGSRGWAKYYAPQGDLFIRAQNLKNDYLDLTDSAYVVLPEMSEGKRTRVRHEDLLITITGANVTKTALVKSELGNAYVSQHVALCRLNEKVDPNFAYWYLISEFWGRRQLNEMAYGAGKPGLNLENIKSVRIPLPSIEAQQETVAAIENKLPDIDNLEKIINSSLKKAKTLRQSILKRAFEGKLVPQDPNDEPTSMLLERILQEQTARPKAARRKRKVEAST